MDLNSLTAHLEKQRSLLNSAKSATPPQRHVERGSLQAYKEYLQREIDRTERKMDVVRNRVVKIGAK